MKLVENVSEQLGAKIILICGLDIPVSVKSNLYGLKSVLKKYLMFL